VTPPLEQVAVTVEREARRRVPEPPGNEQRLLPRRDQVVDARVPEIVEADSRQARSSAKQAERIAVERLAEAAGVSES
jgi:hypothetical protein